MSNLDGAITLCRLMYSCVILCILLSEDLFYLYSVDLDEMQHYAAFVLGLHCLQRTRLGVSRIQRVTGSTLLPLSNIVNWINNSLPNNGGSMMLLKIGTICATR